MERLYRLEQPCKFRCWCEGGVFSTFIWCIRFWLIHTQQNGLKWHLQIIFQCCLMSYSRATKTCARVWKSLSRMSAECVQSLCFRWCTAGCHLAQCENNNNSLKSPFFISNLSHSLSDLQSKKSQTRTNLSPIPKSSYIVGLTVNNLLCYTLHCLFCRRGLISYLKHAVTDFFLMAVPQVPISTGATYSFCGATNVFLNASLHPLGLQMKSHPQCGTGFSC